MIDFTISLVTANNKKLIMDCLRSIYETVDGLNVETYVVINASSDDSETAIRKHFPEVNLIINKEKLSFTKNHNMVMRMGKGKYILILNDDTIILENALKSLIGFMETSSDVGVVGPKIFNPDMSLQWSCGKSFNHKFEFFKAGVLCTIFPFLQKTSDKKTSNVTWVTGACLLARTEAIRKVGLFDENIIIYFEDGDLCYRMMLAGWRVVFYPQAEIIHYHGQTRKQFLARDMFIIYQSRLYFFSKHYGRPTQSLVRILTIMELIIRYMKTSLHNSDRQKKELLNTYKLVIQLALATTPLQKKESLKDMPRR